MTQRPMRRAGLATAAALALTTAGCGDAEMGLSTNRGSGSFTEETTVQNAFIVPEFVPGRCAIQTGTGAILRFTVTNNRSIDAERLTGISTGVAEQVDVQPVEIPVESTVGFGEPSIPAQGGGTVPAVPLGELDPGVKPAMTADVTFQFEQAGEITIPVPVEACPRQISPDPPPPA